VISRKNKISKKAIQDQGTLNRTHMLEHRIQHICFSKSEVNKQISNTRERDTLDMMFKSMKGLTTTNPYWAHLNQIIVHDCVFYMYATHRQTHEFQNIILYSCQIKYRHRIVCYLPKRVLRQWKFIYHFQASSHLHCKCMWPMLTFLIMFCMWPLVLLFSDVFIRKYLNLKCSLGCLICSSSFFLCMTTPLSSTGAL